MKLSCYFNWPGTIWIISDLHYGHSKILEFERGEFKDIDEHDEFITKKIQERLGPKDTFICLGDLGLHSDDSWKTHISELRCGRKILIMGNHDKENQATYRKYFDEVYPGPLFVNKFIVLSHEPIPTDGYFINIHGHLHDSKLDDGYHINVSAKVCEYKLFQLNNAAYLLDKIGRIKARFLNEWYADKYVFLNNKYRDDCFVYKDTGHIIPKDELEHIFTETKKLVPSFLYNKYEHYIRTKDSKLLKFETTTDSIAVLKEGFDKFIQENLENKDT